jgi:uncharacterized protein (DUF1697 family)
MTVFVGLLRAINVGGTGKLPMTELVSLCGECGFKDVKTYIQSGNVVFKTSLSEPKAQAKLERALEAHMGKAVGVTLRSADELEAALAHNPFKKPEPNRVYIMFVNDTLPRNALDKLVNPGPEEVELGQRELFVHYPDGMGRSKLKLPFVKVGTARNLNTVTKLIALARALER